MLKRSFDPKLLYRYVSYGRMSDEDQNPRSPDQQFDSIEKVRQQRGFPWIRLGTYRDDAVKGRLILKRPGLQEMLRDIGTGRVKPDLIAVDTFERFGRAEEIALLRRDLHKRYGILVVTADSGFADPTSMAGKALAFVEQMRATESNYVKAHEVLRGKIDTARQGHWPGGPAPFGCRIESVFTNRRGRTEFDYSVLVPNTETAWIITRMFAKGCETAWGQTRLARFLNECADIPAALKPFQGSTVGRWLDNRIYVGELVFNRHSTDIIDDCRVIERNPESELVIVPGFCEPLVARAVWDAYQSIRNTRRKPEVGKGADGDDKLIAPLRRGLALNYLLSGLVRCGECGRSMTASSTGIYVTTTGEQRRYVTYVCPAMLDGSCDNAVRVPEDWLRNVVVGTIQQRLFPLT